VSPDFRLLQQYLPRGDIARGVCSQMAGPPTEGTSLVKRQNNFCDDYLDRSNCTILRVIPLSAQFGITRHGVNTISRSPVQLEISDLFGADPLGIPGHLDIGSPLVPFNAIGSGIVQP